MKYSLFKSTFWLGSFVFAFMSSVQLPSLGNFSNSMPQDSPKFLLFSQPVLAQKVSSNAVLVYGNPRCGWTNNLIQELKAKKIPYQFKNLDVKSVRDEWNRILEKNGVPDGSPVKLPVVLVNNKVLMRPSIEQVIAQRKKAENSTFQIPSGRYFGNTELIEIKNRQYCGGNMTTGRIECYPISDLKYIKPGVVQLWSEYFCSEKLFKITSSGQCTANGWVER
ncbi:hypothetical protein C789_908 [Microcystis aeruginosa FACHB-905 = DIANCHI905]|nr:hypothetical protein C789_908 [Microcystis aeruginosa FACHB-905 = DIANCHI905]